MKQNRYQIVFALLAMLMAFSATAQVEKEVKKDKRIVIIKKTGDSTERDTIEIHLDDIDSENSELPSEISDFPQNVISSGNMTLGFSNVQRNGNGLGLPPFPALPGLPELNNGKSLHVGIENNWGFNLIKGKLRLWMGLRYDINNYRFSNSDTRLTENQKEFTKSIDSQANSVKSKVVTNYIGVPIAIGFQSNANSVEDGFAIRAGVNAGYRVRTHTKVKLENGNKDKAFDDFNFNDFALTPFVMISYNSIGLYARYTTTPLFKEGQGEEAYAVQFGLIFQ